MRCSHCNMENPSDSKFCGNCGQPLEPEGFGAFGENGQTQEGRVEERKPAKRAGKGIWVVTAGVVLILAAAVAVFLILGSRRDAKEMEDLLAKGDQYLEELDYKEAEDQYLEAISIDPKKEEPYLKLAEIYVQQNQPQKAVKILEEGRKNTESDVILEKYSLYSYVDEVLIPEKGECQEGEYLCKYKYTENYMGLESVHSQKGVLTSRIRDFDGDGAEELLVLLLVNGEELDSGGLQYVSEGEQVNGIVVQMYEMEGGEVVLKDEFQGLCPVLGYGDEESDGVFLQESEGTIYICGSLHQLVNTYADGSSIQSFVMTYEDGAFVRQTGSEELSVGSDFYEERESAWEMADFLEGIGLPGEAAQIRESYMRKFDFVDEVDDMLVRITGENDGTIDREAFFRTGSRYPEYLGNVIVRLQTTWEQRAEAKTQEGTESAETEDPPEVYVEGTVEMTGTIEEVQFSHPNGMSLTAIVIALDTPAELQITHDSGTMTYEDCEQIQLAGSDEIDASWYGKHVKVTGNLQESPMTAYYLDTYVIWDPVLEEE